MTAFLNVPKSVAAPLNSDGFVLKPGAISGAFAKRQNQESLRHTLYEQVERWKVDTDHD